MRLYDGVFEHVYGLLMVLFVVPVVTLIVVLCLPLLCLRPIPPAQRSGQAPSATTLDPSRHRPACGS